MSKRLLSFFLAAILLLVSGLAQAAEPAPGDVCPVAQRYIRVGGPETAGLGHLMVCGADNKWKSVISSDAAGKLTKLGNLTCNTNEILKFNGTIWACAASPGMPTCSEGEGLIYTGGTWACQPQTPDVFSFTDQTDVALSTLITSDSVTIIGISGSVPVSVSGAGSPKISINGGSWVTSGTIANGQSLQVSLTSSSSNTTQSTAVVSVGGGSDQWDVTTIAPCSGVMVGGYCWYLGATAQNCDTTCSSHGSCNLTGTKNYAGSSGNTAQCQAVLAALSVTIGSYGENSGSGFGCAYNPVIPARTRDLATTTCSASYSSTRRACACNN